MDDRYRVYWDEMPCYLSVHDPDLRIIDGNRRFRTDFGDSVGQLCYRVYKRRDDECPDCPVRATFVDGTSHGSEQTLTTLAGIQCQVMVHTTPILDADQRVVAVMEMHTDISEVKAMQSQLADIGLLVSSTSHGIKGLLTGIDGGTYLVNSGLEKGKPDRVSKGWEMVQRNVDRIRTLVMNILYYTKDRPLQFTTIDLAGLIEDIRSVREKRVSDLGIHLGIHVPERIGSLRADTPSIRTMLLNILDNAIDACSADRSSAQHEVTIALRRCPPWLVFEVTDNGIGMDHDTRNRMFTLFFSTKGSAGTGLGMFIANRIVTKHGGSIEVESQPGRGTRFQVRLPLRPQPVVAAKDLEPASASAPP